MQKRRNEGTLPAGVYRCTIADFAEVNDHVLQMDVRLQRHFQGVQFDRVWSFEYDFATDGPERLRELAQKLGVTSKFFKPSCLLDKEFHGRVENGNRLLFHALLDSSS